MPRPSSFTSLVPLAFSYMASGGSLIASSAAQLLTFAILARALGVVEFSAFIAITAVTAIAVQICGLGAQEALVRRVARAPEDYPLFLGHNLIMGAASGAVLMVLGLIVLPQLFTLSPDPLANLVLLGMLLLANIVLARIILFVEQVFIAHSDFGAANRNVLLFAFGRLAAAALGCLVFGVDTLGGFVAWTFAAHVIVALLAMRSIWSLGAPRLRLVRDEIGNGLLFSTPFILRALRQNIDLLLLSALTGAEIVASYGVARRIVESGYLSVEALNRLLYPGSAARTREGLHHGLPRFRKALLAAVLIGAGTAVVIMVGAPLLPLLFGQDYVSLTVFSQVLAPTIALMAIYATAQEALGSSGHHLQRAMIFNTATIVGGVAVALATWFGGITGTFIASYATELATAAAAWIVLLRLARTTASAPIPTPLREASQK